jgi:hypothetical protein
MDNLIKDTATLELFCWLEPGAELPGWDILKGSPFGATLASPEGGAPTPGDQLLSALNTTWNISGSGATTIFPVACTPCCSLPRGPMR